MPYNWDPVFRFVPTDGPEEVLVLAETFTETTGPVRIKVAHKPDIQKRNDVNRRDLAVVFGFRPWASLRFEFVDTAAFGNWIALLINRLANPSWRCFLSLDSGVTFREVALETFKGPEINKDKLASGANYEIAVHGVELLESIPAVGVGTW